jgi:hypothetical protein
VQPLVALVDHRSLILQKRYSTRTWNDQGATECWISQSGTPGS